MKGKLMSLHEDDLNRELEQLVAAARPTLNAAAQHRLVYAAGLAAGRDQAVCVTKSKRRQRWMLVASHVASSLAAGWLVFAIMPALTTSSSNDSSNSRTGSFPEMALREPSSMTERLPTAESDGILRPSTRPAKFVEFINNRAIQTSSSNSETESEQVLTSRSILF